MSKVIDKIADSLQSKLYVATSNRMDRDSEVIDRALDIVKDFIIERKLILFGGQAIDYALKLKGSYLYPNDVRPDYDFLSPNHAKDAYDLVDILLSKGFDQVNAIRALHVQTLRVRINMIPIADVGFVPEAIFKKLPTFTYIGGMRVVSPDYQRVDMHSALNLPFRTPSRECIFNRWKKDIKRLNLFQKFFPIEVANPPTLKFKTAKCSLDLTFVASKVEDLSPIAINGFAAYAIIFEVFEKLIGKVPESLIKLKYTISKNTISTEYPDMKNNDDIYPNNTILLQSYDLPNTAIRYRPLLDIMGEMRLNNGALFMDTEHHVYSVSYVKISAGVVRIATTHGVLMWLAVMAMKDPDNSDIYKMFYKSLFDLTSMAEFQYSSKMNAGNTKELMDEFLNSPFVPSLNVFGKHNVDAGYIIKNSKIINKFQDQPPEILNLPNNLIAYVKDLPDNYYQGKERPEIKEIDNILFKLDGAKYFEKSTD
jgi:hypothetical protein